jgi:LacI family transcriptional regulator
MAKLTSKTVTIHDIAREMGLSASSVSRALANHSRISKETRDKVAAVALEMGYRPNTVASNLRKGQGNTLGVIVPRINRHFFSNVIGGIERVANAEGFQVVIGQSLESFEKEKQCLQSMMHARVDGIIISVSAETTDITYLKAVKDSGIPLFFFDRVVESLGCTMVMIDDFQGAFDATEHLIAQGCKNIAHLGGPDHINVYRNRFNGYVAALEKHQLKVNDQLISREALTKKKGQAFVEQLLEQGQTPDGIFAVSDYSALGALFAFQSAGYRVPNDIKLAGFANEPFTELLSPALSTVEQFPEKLGTTVAQQFFNSLQRDNGEPAQENILIKPQLIVRASSLKQ